MSTHDDAPHAADSGSNRIRPHQLALGLGLGIALFTAISGILPQITGWENDNEIHRTVFGMANLMVSPLPYLTWGFEYQYGRRVEKK